MGFRAAPPPAYLVTGAQAAGKSGVAEALAQRFPRSVHVPGDAFRRMIVRGRLDMTPDAGGGAVAQLELRHRLTAMVADEYHRAGFAVVVQDIVIGPHLAAMVSALRARPLHVIVLAPREAGRDTAPLGLWLDTSDLSVEGTVDEILRRQEEALVDSRRL